MNPEDERRLAEAVARVQASESSAADEIERMERTAPHLVDELMRRLAEPEDWFGRLLQRAARASSDALHAVPIGPGDVLAGKYRILRLLGEGGMGLVYQALDQDLEREVAIKMTRPGLDAKSFVREAQVTALLRDPNVVALYTWGEHERRPFAVMEYVAGGSLDTADNRQRFRGNWREIAALVRDCARTLATLHQRFGLQHRDLKPRNILVAEVEQADPGAAPRYVLKIADFGLANRFDTVNVLSVADIGGTPAYIAPELAARFRDLLKARPESISCDSPMDSDTPTIAWRGDPENEFHARGDVYGLAGVLFFMLTDRDPIELTPVRDAVEQFDRVANTRPTWQPGDAVIPGDLRAICMQGLAADPDQRYSSAAVFADELQRFLDGRPIEAAPAGRVMRLRYWMRREPLAAMLLTGLAVLVLVLIGAASMLYRTWSFARQANTELAAKKGELEHKVTELEEANGHFLQTMDGLAKVMTQPAGHSPEAMKREVAVEAKRQLEAFRTRAADNRNARARETAARLELIAATVAAGVSDREAAIPDFDAAEAGFLRLVDEFPDRPDFLDLVATVRERRGALLRSGLDEVSIQRGAQDIARAVAAERLRAERFWEQPAFRRDLARKLVTYGTERWFSGAGNDARRAFDEARGILVNLHGSGHDDVESRLDLIRCLLNLGALLLREPGFQVDGSLREQVDTHLAQADRLLAETPASALMDRRFRQEMARLAYTRGLYTAMMTDREARRRRPNWEPAAALMREAVSRMQALADEEPGAVEYQRLLVTFHLGLGNVIKLSGKPEQAQLHYEQSLTRCRELQRRYPNDLRVRDELGAALANLGQVRHEAGRHDEAWLLLNEAVDIANRAARTDPGNPLYREHLRNARAFRGAAALSRREAPQALEDFEAAIRLNQEPLLKREYALRLTAAQGQMQQLIGGHARRIRSGEPEAICDLLALARRDDRSPLSCEWLARALVKLPDAGLESLVVDLLRAARDGNALTPQQLKSLAGDPDFAPLRDNVAFLALVSQ